MQREQSSVHLAETAYASRSAERAIVIVVDNVEISRFAFEQ